MRLLTTVAGLIAACLPHTASAEEEFTTEAAIAARTAYEADLKAAREKYAAALGEAAKAAAAAGELDEIVRIKETMDRLASGADDPIVQARKQLEGTKWTFNRPGSPKRIYFIASEPGVPGKAKASPGGKGVWQMLEPRVCAVKLGESLFLFRFNEEMTRYEVIALGQTKTNFSAGTKLP